MLRPLRTERCFGLLTTTRKTCRASTGILNTRSRYRLVRHRGQWLQTRSLNVTTLVAPPLIFTGLFLGLWAWKCTMLIAFQNAIIYNPFLPPNARSMRIADYARECGGIKWREERILSLDGTEIALCIAEAPSRVSKHRGPPTPVFVLYFQGV